MVDWKTIAIMLMIVVILESIYLVYLHIAGYQYIESEAKCSATCVEMDYVAYQYDTTTKYCYCFDQDGEMYKVDVK